MQCFSNLSRPVSTTAYQVTGVACEQEDGIVWAHCEDFTSFGENAHFDQWSEVVWIRLEMMIFLVWIIY